MKYGPDDIPYDLAYSAFRGNSFDPEIRAKFVQEGYVRHMNELVNKYGHLPGADAELERYRAGYTKRVCAWLQAKSRVMSPMVTGPAKFPWDRNEKLMEIEHKRRIELTEWSEQAIERLERNLGLRDSGIISSDDPEALEKLNKKLVKLAVTHSFMKEANAQARKEGKPAPYPDYKLRNSSAMIRGLKKRIAELEARADDTTTEIAFDGGVIIDNVEENRVQIIFDSKPDEETRDKLKARGFRWAPSQGAWQRQRTANALWAAKSIVVVE